jgi:tight adherence protein C
MSDLGRDGALLGLVAGVGLLLMWAGLPRNRRPGLAARVMPYLRDTPRPSALLGDGPARGLLSVVAVPVLGDLARGVERVLGGAASVRSRQLRAGLRPDVDRFRAEQVLWGVAGAVAGATFGTLSALTRDGSVVTVLLLTGLGFGLGVAAADYLLSSRATRRERRMLAEFPTIAELLALSVGAGEGAIGALERVCRLSEGELATELRSCLADARAGANLPSALQGLADRTGLPSLRRFVDGVVVAVERGTPLADVLRAQAQDVREEGRRSLMEAGGRKEIVMMVPVVFLILPVTVLFAVFPGFSFFRFTL